MKMKKIYFTLLCCFFAASTYAQNSYMEIVRSTLKTEKKALIAEVMQLSDAESTGFWEVYNEYEQKQYTLNTDFYNVVMDFADNYENMSDEKAIELMNKVNKFDFATSKLDKIYLKKMLKVVSPQKALRFFQASRKIQTLINAELAAEVPLLETID